MSAHKHDWVREALEARGYKQRDLATAWSVSEGAISRWMSGQERQDLPISRARALSRMLGITLDELVDRLGYGGDNVIKPMIVQPGGTPQVGTMNVQPMAGRIRFLLHLDLPPEVAGRLVQLLGDASTTLPQG